MKKNYEKRYYFLIFGADSCRDGDYWIGIYENIEELRRMYENVLRDEEMIIEIGTRLKIYEFRESKTKNGQTYVEVSPEELWGSQIGM